MGPLTAACLTLPIALYYTNMSCEQHKNVVSLTNLQEAVYSLEKLFSQLKKCTLTVQEADALLSKFKL